MKELENSKSLDVFSNIYDLSKKYYNGKCPIKRIDISLLESKKCLLNFFKYISNNNTEVVSSIKRYDELSYYASEIEGLIFVKNDRLSKIKLPFLNNLYSLSICVHEYTHALNMESVCKCNDIFSHEEILPFLNQYMFLEYISKVYSYDTKQVIESSKYFMIQEQIFLNIKSFMDIIEHLNNSDIDENMKKEYINKLQEHYKYIVGALYSLQLYDYYKMDEKMFLKEYKKIYTEKSKIDDLLDFYSISLKNKENILLIENLSRRL